MDSRPAAVWQLSAALCARVVLIGILAVLCTHLIITSGLYATAAVVGGLMALLSWSVARRIAQLQQDGERQLRCLIGGGNMGLPRSECVTSGLALQESAREQLQRLQAQHQRQIEHLQTLLDTVTAALIVVEPDGHIQLANQAARALAGRTVQQLSEITVMGEVAADILSLRPGAREVMATQSGLHFFVAAAQFASPGAEPQRLISVQRMGEFNAIELKAWIDMARILAHEIMSSLTPVASLAESLENLVAAQAPEDNAGEILAMLEVIKRRSSSLLDFVDRYRSVTQLPEPRLESILLRDLIGAVVRLFSSRAPPGTVCVRISPDDLTLWADRQLIEQALINLLQNALDAHLDGADLSIVIQCSRGEGHVEVAVSDLGSGIPDTIRDNIFLPFFSTKERGSGIGLTLARQIAVAHHGWLEARRNQPRGSVLVLTLPSR